MIKLASEPEPKSVSFAQRNVEKLAFRYSLIDNPKVKSIFNIICIRFWGWSVEGVRRVVRSPGP